MLYPTIMITHYHTILYMYLSFKSSFARISITAAPSMKVDVLNERKASVPEYREESSRESKNSSDREDSDLQQRLLLLQTESAKHWSLDNSIGNSHPGSRYLKDYKTELS